LTGQKLDVAHALLRDGSLTVREVAKQIQVSEATLYKHIPAPRSLLLSPQLAENRT
jgi:predicted transcriptional regulator